MPTYPLLLEVVESLETSVGQEKMLVFRNKEEHNKFKYIHILSIILLRNICTNRYYFLYHTTIYTLKDQRRFSNVGF